MRRTAFVVATLAVLGLTLSTAYVGGDSQASAATGHVTLVRHHGHYGHHHGARYGYSLRPHVGYHHGWGHGHGYGYPSSRVHGYGVYGYGGHGVYGYGGYGYGGHGYGVYAYPHRTYYRAPYAVSPYYGHGYGYSCY